MIKLGSGFQTSSGNQTISSLANRKALPATFSVYARRMLKCAQTAHVKNRIAQQDAPDAAKIHLINYSLQDLAVDEIGESQSFAALDQAGEV